MPCFQWVALGLVKRGFPPHAPQIPPLPLCAMTHLMTLCVAKLGQCSPQQNSYLALVGRCNEPFRTFLHILSVALFSASLSHVRWRFGRSRTAVDLSVSDVCLLLAFLRHFGYNAPMDTGKSSDIIPENLKLTHDGNFWETFETKRNPNNVDP